MKLIKIDSSATTLLHLTHTKNILLVVPQ